MICCICEKSAPLESLEKYDPGRDISLMGKRETYDVNGWGPTLTVNQNQKMKKGAGGGRRFKIGQ